MAVGVTDMQHVTGDTQHLIFSFVLGLLSTHVKRFSASGLCFLFLFSSITNFMSEQYYYIIVLNTHMTLQ